jgi:hypothetical protein
MMKHPSFRHSIATIGLLAIDGLCAQTISPSVIGASGGSGTVGTVSLDWTVGEVATTKLAGGSNYLTQGFHQGDAVKVALNMRAFLQGPYNPGSGAMSDGLRASGLIPTQEPYTALGYDFVGGGGESTTQSTLDIGGSNAIIDWVVLELRDKNDNTSVLYSRSALLQADGDIVATNGSSPVDFPLGSDDYYLAVLHRNHLSVVSLSPITLSRAATTVDLTDGSTPTYGTEAQRVVSGIRVLWAGDVTFDGSLRYTGQDNDRDPILSAIGGVVPTSTINGYRTEDVNLDGAVRYTGQDNDRDFILQNIGGVVPTNTRAEQVP